MQLAESTIRLAESTTRAIEGHDVDAASGVPDELVCAVCLHPAFGGVTTKCEHNFHKDCLLAALQETEMCPTCREALPPTDQQRFARMGLLGRNILGRAEVSCPQNCGSNVKWERLRHHVEQDCANTLFACPHSGCEAAAMPRTAVEAHAEQCGHRMVTCACQQEVKQQDMAAHRAADCAKEPVACEYCGEGNIERGSMDRHLTDCRGTAPMSLVRSLVKANEELAAQNKELAAQNKELAAQVQELKVQASTTTYELRLPCPVRDLSVDSDGRHEADFSADLFIRVYPRGQSAAKKGWVSAYLGTRRTLTLAEFSIKIGDAVQRHTGERKFEKDGPFGWPDFAALDSVRAERAIVVSLRRADTTVIFDL